MADKASSFPKPETDAGVLFETALRNVADPEKLAAEMLGTLVTYLNLETVLSLLAEHLEAVGEAYREDYGDKVIANRLDTIAYRVSALSERVGRNDPTA